MLNRVKIVPLAAESLGVRSMCTFVETDDVRLLLDAGVSLCPVRFGFPPHPQEFKAIFEARQRIAAAAEKADVVTISHYHYDHVTPSFEDWLCNWTESEVTARQIYEGKHVLAKNPRDHVNYSQRERGWLFQKTSGRFVAKLEFADSKSFCFGDTEVEFSCPVFHGSENTELGWVLMTTVKCPGETFLFAPDVQGPMIADTLQLILAEKPDLLILGGPPFYLEGLKVSEEHAKGATANMRRIVQEIRHTIIDHHLLRMELWRNRMSEVIDQASTSNNMFQTAAEYLGRKNSFLEASRKQLFAEDPPSEVFKQWMHLNEERKKHTRPKLQN